jgi:protein MAK11
MAIKRLGVVENHEGSSVSFYFIFIIVLSSVSTPSYPLICHFSQRGRINSISIHPSGKIALSVSADKTVRLWNLMTAHKASVHKIMKGENLVVRLFYCMQMFLIRIRFTEGLVVRWNTAGDQYAILFERQVIIYNVAVSN